MSEGPRVRVVGAGRAGGSFARALARSGWEVEGPVTRDASPDGDRAVDLILLCVPDRAVAEVAQSIRPGDHVVGHVAGSLRLDVLAPHVRRCSVHPLVSLANPESGAASLMAGASFAVSGDPLGATLVEALGGRVVPVADQDRVSYHAAACIASNHLVALMGQVERVAAAASVPLDAFWGLVRGTLENLEALGPAAALTGPAARGDWSTIEAHRGALDPRELVAYDAMVEQARRLVEGVN